MIVYAIDIDNMHTCSDYHCHYIFENVYADKNTAIDMLINLGFEQINNELYVWQPAEENDYNDAPFIDTRCGVQATIVECKVIS